MHVVSCLHDSSVREKFDRRESLLRITLRRVEVKAVRSLIVVEEVQIDIQILATVKRLSRE